MKNFNLTRRLAALLSVAAVIATPCTRAHAQDADPEPASGKVAFITTHRIIDSSTGWDQEKAAYEYFTEKYLPEGAAAEDYVIYADNVESCKKLSTGNFKGAWLHIDCTDQIGWRKLLGAFLDQSNLSIAEFSIQNARLVSMLHDFMVDGGNIYLSGEAPQILVGMWRINPRYAQNLLDTGGQDTADEWGFNCNGHFVGRDYSTHPIFKDVINAEGKGYVIGGQCWRPNHNTLWNLNGNATPQLQYACEEGSNLEKFEFDNLCTVLGGFHWQTGAADQQYAGIVEFHPFETWNTKTNSKATTGAVITNGIAAFQYNTTNNSRRADLEKFTANVLDYLCTEITPYKGDQHKPGLSPTSSGLEETIESTGRIGLYLGVESLDELNNYPEELAAYHFFKSNFMDIYEGRADIIFSNELDKIRFSDNDDNPGFECIWVNCDRDGFEQGCEHVTADDNSHITPTYEHLQKIFPCGDGFIAKLQKFAADGGNLYFTKWANLLTVPMGHTELSPNQVTSVPKTGQADTWGLNNKFEGFDNSSHPIFQNLSGVDSNNVPLFSGAEDRSDRTCAWWLTTNGDKAGPELEGYNHSNHAELISKFNADHNATILSTWAHESDYSTGVAVVVEFHPRKKAGAPQRITPLSTVLARRGTAITNGAGAYQWSTAGTENNDDQHVKELTSNILAYLTPVWVMDTTTGIDGMDDENASATPRWFTVDGIEVARPTTGLYIEVRGNRTRKILL